MHLSFDPSAERGAALDARMRARLADTLNYVFDQVGEELGVGRDDAADVVGRVRAGHQSPHVFGAYYEMVLALEEEDLDAARAHARAIREAPPVDGIGIGAIDDRPRPEAERYRRLFLEDQWFAEQPDEALLKDALSRIAGGFDLLDRGFPEMASEIRQLLREIVIAAGTQDPKAMTFDGVSSYMLWGAVLLNARGQSTILDTAQALAHESGHNLLFGFCSSGPLIENEGDELFSSPLRLDPRPMDGVVHATYVTARMHQTAARLLASGVLDAGQAEAARTDLALHQRNFASGDQVVRESGRLTALGHEVIETARAYMRSAA